MLFEYAKPTVVIQLDLGPLVCAKGGGGLYFGRRQTLD
jgi:hypothetical protein